MHLHSIHQFIRFGRELNHLTPHKQHKTRRQRPIKAKVSNAKKINYEVLLWIEEAIAEWRKYSTNDPSFEWIQWYVEKHHNYTLSRKPK